MSHTPGPWGWFHQFLVTVRADGTVPIGAIEVARVSDVSPADSQLIAAAPDLLEALTLLLKQTDEHWHDETIAMGFARAAITKATT